jgi:hypothetical protein
MRVGQCQAFADKGADTKEPETDPRDYVEATHGTEDVRPGPIDLVMTRE